MHHKLICFEFCNVELSLLLNLPKHRNALNQFLKILYFNLLSAS